MALSVLSRLIALSGTVGCRFVSRGAVPWTVQRHVRRDRPSSRASGYGGQMSGEDFRGYVEDEEDVEGKLQALVDEGKKKQKTVKYHILRRQMTPPGAPQRKLSWDAIEQIRFLKQEQPEEWTVENLAEGFSVTPDVILRVLRSKFVPVPERKAKQDAKAMSGQSQQVLPSGVAARQDRLQLPGNNKAALLPSGGGEVALVALADQTRMIRGEGAGTRRNALVTALPNQVTAGFGEEATVTRSTEEGRLATHGPEEYAEEEESWDGQVFTEEQLEEFLEMEKPPPVMQVGNDFFDTEGNFAYRI